MYMIACLNAKDRSLAEMIRFHERRVGQLRECLTQRHEADGRTPMHMACAHPQGTKCVSELLDAWLRIDSKNREAWNVRDNMGKCPKDLASGKTLELLEEWVAEDEEEDDTDDAEDDDGLTSTQRSKLKKKMLEASERAGAPRAVVVTKSNDEREEKSIDEDDENEIISTPEPITASSTASVSQVAPEPIWPEVIAWYEAVKNLRPIYEVSVSREDSESEPLPLFPDDTLIDPALWFCNSLNRLQLKLSPRLTILSSQLSRLTNLTILIVSGNGLEALPDCIEQLPLKSLDASRNAIRTLPKMPHKTLEALDMAVNQLSDIESLSECANLVSLALDNNPDLSSLSPLPFDQMKRIISISASHAAIAELDPGLGSLVKLETLILSHNPFTELPPALAACKKLKLIKVDSTKISDNKVLGYIDKGEMKQLAKYWEKNSAKSTGGGGKKGKKR
eukprot:CAMPEP_0197313830 /NCGR_PEP_ID=MMETSP0891-20130614/30847_1 /TAXON_ID=44058 ORGANISM="Aureoumbra lagunensis, Strain CCMP1510" /NCGR_SAMPLE_ID=MMETSP0891 /ASSEMBLY_ACC=CAM_ASM_000534 /LENGTH=449 /DNA_ID=CAMNT_0042801939 /DNA_START=100 /DNA_END=1449 /DNA_ORIENTATION=+